MTHQRINFWHYLKQLALILQLARLPNCVALGVLFLTCQEHYSHGTLTIHDYARAATWVSLAAFAYIYNDICDIDVDRVNRPNRVLPSGSLPIRRARQALWGLGLVIALFVMFEWQWYAFWPVIAVIGSIFYSRVLRAANAFLSNIVASLLVAAVPLSSHPVSNGTTVWYLALGVGLLIFARELQKDALDMPGDIAHRPIPLLLGTFGQLVQLIYPVVLVISALFLTLAMTSNSPSTVSRFGTSLLALTLIIAAIKAMVSRSEYRTQSNVIKFASYLLVLVMAIRNV